MNGMQNDLRAKILGMSAHLVVTSQEAGSFGNYQQVAKKIEENKEVTGTSPVVYGQAILKSQQNGTGVFIKGVIPAQLTRVTDISAYLVSGNLDGLTPKKIKKNAKGPVVEGIVIGRDLARTLGVGLNEDLLLISSQSVSSGVGIIPLMRKFKVTGIFDSGHYEYDSNLAYIPMETAQNIFGVKNKVSGIEVKTTDSLQAEAIAGKLQTALGPALWVRSWVQMNRNLFSALKLEKITMFVILTLIVLVACFNIVGTLMIITIQKTRSIGILRAIGATRRSIMNIFIYEGLIIGAIGLAAGTVIGSILCYLQAAYKIIKLPGDVYYLSYLPVKMQLSDGLIIAVAALLISFLATVYPSYKASRLNPVEAIRYE
jgi:lipoprotein-releasing system permease protein